MQSILNMTTVAYIKILYTIISLSAFHKQKIGFMFCKCIACALCTDTLCFFSISQTLWLFFRTKLRLGSCLQTFDWTRKKVFVFKCQRNKRNFVHFTWFSMANLEYIWERSVKVFPILENSVSKLKFK